MKKLILIFALLVTGFTISAQTTYTFDTYNPLEITLPNTSTHIIQFPTNSSRECIIYFDSSNASPIKVNAKSATMTNAPGFTNTNRPNGLLITVTAASGYRIRISGAANDKLIVILL